MSRSGVGCRFKKIASGDTRLFTLSISDVAVKARCVKHPGCWMFLMLARAPTQINAIDILTSSLAWVTNNVGVIARSLQGRGKLDQRRRTPEIHPGPSPISSGFATLRRDDPRP